jgi:hypothetical protein
MRRHLFLSIVLALLVAPLGARCGGGQLSTAPSDERATTQPDDGKEPITAPTADPQTEAGAMTATPTPGAMEVELPAGAEIVVARCVQQGRPYHRSALLLRSTKVIRVS